MIKIMELDACFHALWISLFIGTVTVSSGTVWWRATDGTLAEHRREAMDQPQKGVRVLPEAEGVPVLRFPFAIAAGEVVEVSLDVQAALREADAGAEGQADLVLTVLPAASRHNYNPNAEYRQIVIVGTQPETIRFAFRAGETYEEEGLLLVPTLSMFRRAVDILDARFTLHPEETDPTTLTRPARAYVGHEPDAPWRAEAAQRIDRYRKADLTIHVTDRWGQPVPNATVRIEQQRHAYPFGTAVVGTRLTDAPREFDPESFPDAEAARALFIEDNAKYRQFLLENFNAVVFENELKWPQWAGVRPDLYQQEWSLQAIEWLRERDFVIKGHCMVWGSWRFTPEWLREKEDDVEALQTAVRTHIRDIGNATADRAHYWDVLNEPMSHRNLIELLGMEAVAEWFKEAREAVPNTRLVMNEFDLVGNGGNPTRRARFIEFYKTLQELGGEMDVIGLQGHFWSERFTAPEDVWRIIDELYEATGLPMMISEFDTNFPNEQMQADYTRDFLTAWFAHPKTEAFLMWGFWGGAHWMGDAGALIRRDWTTKPAFYAYRDLVYSDWWTRASLRTDSAGRAQERVFHGQHKIVVEGADGAGIARTIHVPSGGIEITIVIPE